MHDIITTTLPNGGVFVAAFCWIWFETDETGVHGHPRNVVTALLAVVVVAGAVWLLRPFCRSAVGPWTTSMSVYECRLVLIPFRSMIWAHSPAATQLFFVLSVPLWMRSRWLGAAAAIWTSLTICLPLLYRGDHWLSDIVAGAVVAVALMLLLCRLIGATGLPDRVVRFSAAHPRLHYCMAVRP